MTDQVRNQGGRKMAEQQELKGWIAGRVPREWFTSPPEVLIDREEILAIGTLADVDLGQEPAPEALAAARLGRIKQFREDTREERIRIAGEAQRKFGRPISWGARCGEVTELFTTLSVPVMTRLRIRDRQLLDALVEAGVARSRSHALAWCVRLVSQHQSEWLAELKETVRKLQAIRAEAPKLN
jgi:hypothetical protein